MYAQVNVTLEIKNDCFKHFSCPSGHLHFSMIGCNLEINGGHFRESTKSFAAAFKILWKYGFWEEIS